MNPQWNWDWTRFTLIFLLFIRENPLNPLNLWSNFVVLIFIYSNDKIMNFTETLDTNPIFKLVSDSAKQLNIKTFVVGGFVRDLILQRPSKDIDIVCVGSS